MRLICFTAALSVGCVGCFEEPEVGATITQTSGSSTEASTSTNSTPSSGTSGTSGGSGTSSSSDAGSTTLPTEGTESSSGSSSSGGSTGTPGGGREADFFDDFVRDDAPEVGFGWLEKDELVFSILSNQAIGNGTPTRENPEFHDWFVHQPDTRRDIELVAEFTLSITDQRNEPFIFARVGQNSLELGERYSGYMAVAGTENPPSGNGPSDQLCILLFDGTSFGPQQSWCDQQEGGTLSVGFQYQLRLVTTGASPVQLSATLDRRASDKPDDPWSREAEVTQTHQGAAAITTAGSWGFGGGENSNVLPNYAYDSFSAYYLEP